MRVDLNYGDGFKTIHIPEDADVSVLQPQMVPALGSPAAALFDALQRPFGCNPLAEQLRGKVRPHIAIAIADDTRPAPLKALLPVLLQHIRQVLPELTPGAVTIIIGGGLHPPCDSKTQAKLLPSTIRTGCNIVAHDARSAPMIDFGTTRRGTPVKINAAMATAQIKIVIGQIDPHQFVGFTGGSKGIVIGCGAPETIRHNHSLMVDPRAAVGRLEGNPVREDLNEAGRMIGIDLAINVVLNPDKAVVRLLAGEPEAVLKEGAQTCAALYGVRLDTRYDIVVASCGGAPKDSVLYQAQKGLNLASHAVKKGGKILLLAACRQGIGDDVYFDYVCQFATPQAVLKDFKKIGFTMGAHKAYLFGRTLVDYDVAVFSDLDPALMGQCHLRAAEPSNIITEWLNGDLKKPRLAVVPFANTTYFYDALT